LIDAYLNHEPRRTPEEHHYPTADDELDERWGATFAAEPDMSPDRWRALIEEGPQVTAEPGGIDYVEVNAGGVPSTNTSDQGPENRTRIGLPCLASAQHHASAR
jgi:hypothetical protein